MMLLRVKHRSYYLLYVLQKEAGWVRKPPSPLVPLSDLTMLLFRVRGGVCVYVLFCAFCSIHGL